MLAAINIAAAIAAARGALLFIRIFKMVILKLRRLIVALALDFGQLHRIMGGLLIP